MNPTQVLHSSKPRSLLPSFLDMRNIQHIGRGKYRLSYRRTVAQSPPREEGGTIYQKERRARRIVAYMYSQSLPLVVTYVCFKPFWGETGQPPFVSAGTHGQHQGVLALQSSTSIFPCFKYVLRPHQKEKKPTRNSPGTV